MAIFFLLSIILFAFPAAAQKSAQGPGPRTPVRPRMQPSGTPQPTPRETPRRSTSPSGSISRPPLRNDTRAPPTRTASHTAKRRGSSKLGPAEYSPNGPGTVAPRRHALSVGGGWPGAELGYLYGARENLSIGATFNLGYGTGITYIGANVAVMGTVKWRFAKLGPLDAGLRFDVGYFLGPTIESYENNVPGHGVAFTASFLLHYQIDRRISIEPFFAVPVRAAFNTKSMTAVIPMYVGITAEYMVIPRLKLYLRLGGGGAAWIVNGNPIDTSKTGPFYTPGTKWIPWIDASFGVGYAF